MPTDRCEELVSITLTCRCGCRQSFHGQRREAWHRAASSGWDAIPGGTFECPRCSEEVEHSYEVLAGGGLCGCCETVGRRREELEFEGAPAIEVTT